MTKRTDIVYVLPRPEIGGAEKQMLRLVEHLDSDCYRSTVIFLDGPGSMLAEFEQEADDVIVLHRRGLFDLGTFAQLLGHIRRIRPSTVHATLYIANLFGGWAARLAGVPNVVVSQRGLGIDPRHSHIKRAVHAFFNGFIGLFADVRIVNSQAISDRMAAYGWQDCHVIHNGILDRPLPPEGRLAELKLELGIPECSTILATISRIDPKKDLVTMLQAFRLILDATPDSYLLIAGGGFPDYERLLKNEARELGIESRVRFLGFRDDVADLVCLCDISLLSSVTEGLPNAILESMLLAKPVVATRVGGVPELIDNGVEGYTVDIGDTVSFAAHVIDLIRNPDRREDMGILGRARALADFSVEATVSKTTSAYGSGTHVADPTEADQATPLSRNTPTEWAKQA